MRRVTLRLNDDDARALAALTAQARAKSGEYVSDSDVLRGLLRSAAGQLGRTCQPKRLKKA